MLCSQKPSFLSLLLLLLQGSHGLTGDSYGPRCRCAPHEPCWPPESQWHALNSSIDGLLVHVRPVANVCHGAAFNEAACNASMVKSTDSLWRASMPGAVQWTNWEAWPERNQSCFFDSPRDQPCGQGRISLFSAVVEKPEHIQAAVRFAARFNIRLAIKNSGHCFLGRSVAPESLQISTTKLRDIHFTDQFVPAGAPQDQAHHGPAVTLGAGVNLKDVYASAAKHNVTLVAGFAHTVGPTGGYIQGGGHSLLSNWKGMASDNALEFTVITAKGDLLVANDYQNQDLFWALRGGGGGTFGVVVNVTVRTFPSVPSVHIDFGFGVSPQNLSAFWDLTKAFHSHLPAISDAGGAGYYYIVSKPQKINGTEALLISGLFMFPNQTKPDAVHKVVDPLANDMRRLADPRSIYNFTMVPSISDWIYSSLKDGGDQTGGVGLLGSRLVSRNFLVQHDGPQRLRDTLRDINHSIDGGVVFTGHLVAGGAVARSTVDSALNPAWRRALTHVVFSVDWNSTASAAEIDTMTSLARNGVAKLRALEPDMGAYLNEANAYEDDFQRTFWGANYKRLLHVKRRHDPEGLFIARRSVGSEGWDDAGRCRVNVKRARSALRE
ncbi:hypothetical protein HIM_01355 [Hirsutella minnesotensis 3608]|nr:hypothetical protein HIM_01355 [Hirsutella minnesotensis 3608]